MRDGHPNLRATAALLVNLMGAFFGAPADVTHGQELGRSAVPRGSDPKAPRWVIQTGHAGRIDALHSDESGRMLLTVSSDDRSVVWWDLKTGVQLDTFRGDPSSNHVQFVPGQQRLRAIFDSDAGSQLLDLRAGQVIARFPGETLASGRDGTLVCRSSDYRETADGNFQLLRDRMFFYRLNSPRPIYPQTFERGFVNAAALDLSSQCCLWAMSRAQTQDSLVSTINLKTGQVWHLTTDRRRVKVVNISYQGALALIVFGDDTAELWNVRQRNRLWSLPAKDARLSPGGSRLLIQKADSVALLNLENPSSPREIFADSRPPDDSNVPSSLYRFSDDGKVYSFVSGNGEMIFGDTVSGQRLYVGPQNTVPDALHLGSIDACFISAGPAVLRIDLHSGQATLVSNGNRAGRSFRDVLLRPGRSEMLTAAIPGTVVLWDLHGMRRIREFKTPPAPENDFANIEKIEDQKERSERYREFFRHVIATDRSRSDRLSLSDDGNRLAVAYPNGIDLWDVSTGELLKRWPLDEWPVSVQAGKGALDVVAAFADGSSAGYSASVDEPKLKVQGEIFAAPIPAPALTAPFHASFPGRLSPDGAWHVSATSDFTVHLRSMQKNDRRELKGHRARVADAAFSKIRSQLATGSDDGIVKLWDLTSGRLLGEIKAPAGILNLAFDDSRGRLIVGLLNEQIVACDPEQRRIHFTVDGVIEGFCCSALRSGDDAFITRNWAGDQFFLWNAATGKRLADIRVMNEDGQLAVNAVDGRFDVVDLERSDFGRWVFADDLDRPLKPAIFLRDYYEPRLLERVLSGSSFPAVRPLYAVNRIQPHVQITAAHEENASLIRVQMEVGRGSGSYVHNGQLQTVETDVYDLRLFRKGQLVQQWPPPRTGSDVEPEPDPTKPEQMRAWRDAHRVVADGQRVLQGADGKLTLSFPVRIPSRPEAGPLELTTYAFNEDRVKSETARLTYQAPANPRNGRPRAYLIGIGINRYEGALVRDLKFAVADVELIVEQLGQALQKTNRYDIVPIVLSAKTDAAGNLIATATKSNLRGVLQRLAGDAQPELLVGEIAGIDRLKTVTPDDLVLIAYSGHGYTDQRGNLHLLPHDLGPGASQLSESLARCISSADLAAWLREIDAGEIVLILDACHSAAAGAPPGFKPGPLGGRGLAQLAFDKGMRVLAASQADDVALESDKIGHGLLTFALIRDGWQKQLGAVQNRLTLGSLLSYAANRVPNLYEEVLAGTVKDALGFQVNVTQPDDPEKSRAQRPEFFDYAQQRPDLTLREVGVPGN